MAKNYKDTVNLSSWCDLMGYRDWESVLEDLLDNSDPIFQAAAGDIDVDDYTDDDGELDNDSYHKAVTDRFDDLFADYEDGFYRAWEKTVESGMEGLLGNVKLVAVPYKGIGEYDQTYRIKPAQGETWESVLTEIRLLINGVGYFHFDSNKELKDSGPYTAREAVLGHLGYLSQYGEVYGGNGYGRRWFDRELEIGSRYF